MKTEQENRWAGEFGRDYTDRNPHTPEAMDALFARDFGKTRTALNERFLGNLSRSLRILEVGANVGVQLRLLQRMGFTNLCGVELQSYAAARARAASEGIAFVQASGLALPFPDGEFDLVFTSGVLIHIAPDHLGQVLSEIHRCARTYIWGWEYWAEDHAPIAYRGEEGLLWKADFASVYCNYFPTLERVLERRIEYLADREKEDAMFLLRRRRP